MQFPRNTYGRRKPTQHSNLGSQDIIVSDSSEEEGDCERYENVQDIMQTYSPRVTKDYSALRSKKYQDAQGIYPKDKTLNSELTVGQPFTSRNMGKDFNIHYNFASKSTIASPSRAPFPKAGSQQIILERENKSQLRESQEIKIGTLEEIIHDKISVIKHLEDRLQNNRKGHHQTKMTSTRHQSISPRQHEQSLAHAQSPQSQELLETQYREMLSKKNKYKEKAKKYKSLLDKRDKEIMNLVVDSKQLRATLERDHKKHIDIKQKLKEELVIVKDNMVSQLKRQQVNFAHERDQSSKDALKMNDRIQDLQQEIQDLRECQEKTLEEQYREHQEQLMQMKRDFAHQLETKKAQNKQVEQQLRETEFQLGEMRAAQEDRMKLQDDITFYQNQISKYREQLHETEGANQEKDFEMKELQRCMNGIQEDLAEAQHYLKEQQESIQTMKEDHFREIQAMENQLSAKRLEQEKESELISNELERLREVSEETHNSNKKQQIRYERELLEQGNQVKSLNMIISDLKEKARDRVSIEERLESKNTEVKILKSEIDQLREDLLCYKLNLGKQAEMKVGGIEHELLKMSQQNKELKKQLADLKHKLDDMQFKSQRLQAQRSNRDLELDNKFLKDNVLALEKKLSDMAVHQRKLGEENEKLKQECQSLSTRGKDQALLVQDKAQEFKLRERVNELEEYCQELHSQLSKWTRLDKQSQLLVNNLEKKHEHLRAQEGIRTLDNQGKQPKHILIQ